MTWGGAGPKQWAAKWEPEGLKILSEKHSRAICYLGFRYMLLTYSPVPVLDSFGPALHLGQPNPTYC